MRSKISKLRDLLIIILHGLIYAVQKLCACIQCKSKNVGDDRETARCIQRRHLKKKANNAKNEQNTRDKKRKGTARRNENCSKLSLPPVVELIFTRGDVWRARDHTSKLTQVPVYSDNSAKRHPGGERKTPHHHLGNNSPISFSRDVRKSAQAKSNDTQPFAKHRKLGWLQRDKRQWLPSANCKWCLPTTVRSPFTTLSRVNTGKREQAFLEMKYSPLNVDVKLKGDNVANIQCLSHVETLDDNTKKHDIEYEVALHPLDGNENHQGDVSKVTVNHYKAASVASIPGVIQTSV